MLHGVSFAGNQRFDIFAGAVGDFLEGLVFQFIPDEYISLIFRQFVERCKKFFPKNLPQVFGFRRIVIGEQEFAAWLAKRQG